MDSPVGVSHDWMRIRELAEKAGVSRYTIHYYYREGLLPPPLKTGRTMALYTSAHLECLRFIRNLREERDLPIAAVRRELQTRFGEQWRALAARTADPGTESGAGPIGKKQRERILETAVELFSSRGYPRTHVSHITDALHISKATFYLYFKNKHDLLVAVFDHLVQELTKTEQKIAAEADYLARMVTRGKAYVAFYKRYHKIFDIIRAESIGPESRPELSIQAIYRRMLDPMADDLRRAREEGRVPETPADPELLSYMILGALDFLCYRLLMDDKYSAEEIVDMARRSLRIGAAEG
ncbi:MAG: MerR family transcriptional regulator [bacterium]